MNEQLDKLLASVNWKEFEIGELFEIFTGATIPKKDIVVGNIPRVTATDLSNGVNMFTDKIDHRNLRLFSNFISVSFLGSVFYHKNEVSLDMKIHGIKPKHTVLNKYTALFLIPLLENMTFKFNYGYQLSTTILKRQKILLPATPDGQPDWNFMDEYMRMVEESVRPSLGFTEHVITDKRELDEVEWGEFEIGSLFNIVRGRNFPKSEWESGDVPIITTTGLNNGVTDYIGNTNDRVSENTLTVAGTGTVGSTFYHEYKHNVGEWVLSLRLKDRDLDKHLALFLSTSISHQKDKYSYAYKLGNERLSAQKILLPVTPNGEPDWNFMEQYMKRIENDIMKDINIKHKQHVAVVN